METQIRLKTNESFLRFLSMGVVGTRRVMDVLSQGGHAVIELERGALTNKIWSTKPKRLRVPDLLCLQCGIRIESRAKTKLSISMSDSPNNPERRWDKGLRGSDLVALVACHHGDKELEYVPSENVSFIRVEHLRETVAASELSQPKSSAQGSERERKWGAYIPGFSGKVEEVTSAAIRFRKSDGSRYTYNFNSRHADWHVHVRSGNGIEAGATIAASIVPVVADSVCPQTYYNFADDLNSEDRESVYTAVKALGYVASSRDNEIINSLELIFRTHEDMLVRLEAAGSLARLGVDTGVNSLLCTAQDDAANQAVRMEAVFILGEIGTVKSFDALETVAKTRCNPSELRAAAVWEMGRSPDAPVERILSSSFDEDVFVAAHALVSSARLLKLDDLPSVVSLIGPSKRASAAAVEILLKHLETEQIVESVLTHLFQTNDARQRQWLMYLLGLAGPSVASSALANYGEAGSRIASALDLFWNCHNENWIRDKEVNALLDFLQRQK